jgi:hypothetical protein
MKALFSVALVLVLAAAAEATPIFFLHHVDPPAVVPGGTTNFLLDQTAPTASAVTVEEIVLPAGMSASFPTFEAQAFLADTALGANVVVTTNLSANFKMRACANLSADIHHVDSLGTVDPAPFETGALLGTGVPRGSGQGTVGFAPIRLESHRCRQDLHVGPGEAIALVVTVTNTCPAGRHVFLAYDASGAQSQVEFGPLTVEQTAACERKCATLKIKGTGKKASAKAGCWAKAASKGQPADPACLAKAEAAFSSTFAKADAGFCFATPGTSAIETKVDMFISDLLSALQPGAASKCTAAKMKAAGKKAAAKAVCYAKGTSKQLPVDPFCLMKAEGKFAAAFSKADLAGPCPGTTADVESMIDGFVSDAVAELTTPQ